MSSAAQARVKLPPASLSSFAAEVSLLPAASSDSSRRPLDLGKLLNLNRQFGQYSEAAKVALLRRSREAPSEQLLVDFSGREVFTELQIGGRVVWRGDWLWQATVAGQPLAADGAWEEICWHADADVDYLELELRLANGWKLQRQMLLARKNCFLFLADALIGNDQTTPRTAIHFQNMLPLASSIRFDAATETREGWLAAGSRKVATVLPLALPEWRSEFCHADLSTMDNRLALSQAAEGSSLYAPLFLDLARERVRKPTTWRRLTVAEQLEIVPRDVAVGYRAQVGDWQWLFYRSLAPRGNRTVLGQNYSTEFVACRFNRNGTTEDILEIE